MEKSAKTPLMFARLSSPVTELRKMVFLPRPQCGSNITVESNANLIKCANIFNKQQKPLGHNNAYAL